MSIRIEESNSTKRIICLFILFLVFPDFLFYTLGVDNFSISTIISITLLFVFLRAKNICKDNFLIIVALFILLCFNCLLSMLFNIEQALTFKVVLSIYSILIMAYVSSCYAQTLWLCSEEILKRSVFYLFAFLCLIGIISILLQKTEIIHDKSMILFPEPSAFALVFIPIFSFCLYYTRGRPCARDCRKQPFGDQTVCFKRKIAVQRQQRQRAGGENRLLVRASFRARLDERQVRRVRQKIQS